MASPRIKPPALKPGDTVAVVAPAAAIERSYLERGVNALGAMGFRVKVSERVLARAGILAGSDEDRARELQEAFADDSVRAIFAARGGYGCGRILPLLDFATIARSPKAFVGYSDETFLLNTIVQRAGWVEIPDGPGLGIEINRAALAAISPNTRWESIGELEITLRISDVAACCSSASASSRFSSSTVGSLSRSAPAIETSDGMAPPIP